jgi:hypothetical protein
VGADLDKAQQDIRKIEKVELPKLNEEKAEEYKDKLVKFQLKLNKLKAKYEKIKDGSLESLASLAPEGSDLRQKLLASEQ